MIWLIHIVNVARIQVSVDDSIMFWVAEVSLVFGVELNSLQGPAVNLIPFLDPADDIWELLAKLSADSMQVVKKFAPCFYNLSIIHPPELDERQRHPLRPLEHHHNQAPYYEIVLVGLGSRVDWLAEMVNSFGDDVIDEK